MAYNRRADIQMLSAEAGGLHERLTTPTRHLLLIFDATNDKLQIGATITTAKGTPLEPGRAYSVQLSFWVPEAENALTDRRDFNLWAGRIVGSGSLVPNPF
ncbi:MAG: hypothetical protein ABSH36_16375 [Solirubrobacteraceae bacterium]